jgi:hypothetical protein
MITMETKVIKEYSSKEHKIIYAFYEDGGRRGVFGIFKEGKVWSNDTFSGTYYKTIADAVAHAQQIAENNFEYVRNNELQIN